MKKHFIILLIAISSVSISNNLFSQALNLKYGKISNEELEMTTYPKDTSAVAVILYDVGSSYYDVVNYTFKRYLDYQKRVKILKQEGVDLATISIPFYYKSSDMRELITGLEAIAYNIENGKVVKSKLEKKYIFEEEVAKNYKLLKFSIPNVKVGTVIEYKYKLISDLWSLPNWYIQGNIPVAYSKYDVRIPEYFLYNIESIGYEQIVAKEERGSINFNLGIANGRTQTVSCSSRELVYIAENIPALKGDEFVWCVNDFRSSVRFELKGTQFPNDFYKPYSQTWDDLEKFLKDDTDFGQNLRMSNPYKDELRLLSQTASSDEQKIEIIYSFIKNKIRWDENYSFYGNKVREAVKNGTGDNGQINMILISALKDAGINAYPILISRRSQGRLPFTYPTFDRLTTFIVAAETSEGKMYYMDGSARHGGLNMLPSDLLVDRGYTYGSSKGDKWVNLTDLGRNTQVVMCNLTLDANGLLSGERQTLCTNQIAYNYKSRYYSSKDSIDFVEKIGENNQIAIEDISINGKDLMSNSVKEQMKFSKELELQGDYIYLNPMIFMHLKDNPFTLSERKIPVEFSYPYSHQQTCIIMIPEGYEVEELPQSSRITLLDNKGSCLYQVGVDNNQIQLMYRFTINQIIFPFMDYPAVRDFYGEIAQKNNEMIVLKKTSI